MKLLVIDPHKLERINGKPGISMNKLGYIHLNRILCENMNMTKESTISFVQDQESPKDWYLKGGGKLKLRGKDGNGFSTNSVFIMAKIIESLGLDKTKSYSFEVQSDFIMVNAEHYFLILTSKK